MSADITKPSLYDRLGGIYAIASVVDDFIDRIMIDPALNANPLVDDAHHRVGKGGFKYLVTEMVGWATGGPQKYTGRSMRDSHVDLKITEGEWGPSAKTFRTRSTDSTSRLRSSRNSSQSCRAPRRTSLVSLGR
jgi:truncated hemoglobin YjbI